MAMRINHNISSLNTQRQLGNVQKASSTTLEHLSSGLKINKAADGPAALVISENMRAQIAGLNQAVENSENGVSMVQTAEGALTEVNRLLINMRQLAIHASNSGVNDEKMLAADQAELDNAMETIDRISKMTQFGAKRLLDGSRGANGVANGEGLQFVEAGPTTKTSPISGYNVQIDQVATKSLQEGTVELTQQIIDSGETLTISEGGKTISFTTLQGESMDTNLNELDRLMKQSGLKLNLLRSEDNVIRLEHQEFGSEHNFAVASTTAGILSQVANVTAEAIQGKDVKGRINGEEAVGRGQVLTGKIGNPTTEGLSVRFTGAKANEEGEIAGTVSVFQNSLIFQVGANEDQTVAVSLKNMASRALAQGVNNDSKFRALEDVDVTSFQGAQDTVRMVDQAIGEVTQTRAKLGAFQKNTLESNINNLRIATENMTASESVIRDADMAGEMADFTRNQIMLQSGTAMLAQANQQSSVVLNLLK